MTREHAIAFVIFALAAAATPGPSNVLLTATGAQVGVVRGLPCLLGVSVGMAVMLFVVAFGLGSVILDNPLVLTGVRWGGAVVMLWLAWRIATAGRDGTTAGGRPVGFVGAAVFQWVNPKSWLVSASAAATFLSGESGHALWHAAGLASLFFLIALPGCLPWLAFGAVLQRVLRSDRAFHVFNVAMGALLAASVILILA
jgi:threonine/homoserine/homoserine lactone efflux protein